MARTRVGGFVSDTYSWPAHDVGEHQMKAEQRHQPGVGRVWLTTTAAVAALVYLESARSLLAVMTAMAGAVGAGLVLLLVRDLPSLGSFITERDTTTTPSRGRGIGLLVALKSTAGHLPASAFVPGPTAEATP